MYSGILAVAGVQIVLIIVIVINSPRHVIDDYNLYKKADWVYFNMKLEKSFLLLNYIFS